MKPAVATEAIPPEANGMAMAFKINTCSQTGELRHLGLIGSKNITQSAFHGIYRGRKMPDPKISALARQPLIAFTATVSPPNQVF